MFRTALFSFPVFFAGHTVARGGEGRILRQEKKESKFLCGSVKSGGALARRSHLENPGASHDPGVRPTLRIDGLTIGGTAWTPSPPP
jgi:hypothetical protein